ncbi:hypothetical protein [Nocardioides sp.]|uniref:COG4315 family predicted lipoprotein n=1 Tax=Nocardioides sp. TaxID=35761 RepID=UPI00260C4DD6|nr:hypothetical protein [Nocardioides sp.]
MFLAVSRLRSTLALGTTALACLGTLAACGSASSTSTTTTTSSPTMSSTPTASATPTGSAPSSSTSTTTTSALLTVATTGIGRIVTTGSGMTVYRYTKDTKGASHSACTGTCATTWPAVTVAGTLPTKIKGIHGTLATITGADGAKQLTLNGWPLYTYSGDKAAGDTAGQGLDSIWWAITSHGKKVTRMITPAATATPTATAAPSSSSASGY